MVKHNDTPSAGTPAPITDKRPGPGSAGQSGDTQGLLDLEDAGSQSVVELLEEGQTAEAEALLGIEAADERGSKEVRTKQVPEDDIPGEYPATE